MKKFFIFFFFFNLIILYLYLFNKHTRFKKKKRMSLYVLGAGGIGTLVGCSLTNKFNVNFIARNSKKIKFMKANNNSITIKQLFNKDNEVKYRINDIIKIEDIKDEFIPMLVICVKTFDTINSLKPLLPKITNKSKILLIQNGMGVIEELYSKIWPNINDRPLIYQGVIAHGVWQDPLKSNSYDYNHAGYSNMKFCKLPKDLSNPIEPFETNEFTNALIKMDLDVSFETYENLLIFQIQKLMVNCCMNSVTSIIDCINGELKDINSNKLLFLSIIKEGIKTMKKSYPILPNIPSLEPESLLKLVENMGFIINGKNSSSMRQDVLNLRDVEIDYINGFIVKKAKDLGFEAPVNEVIKNLVLTRLSINRKREL